MLFFLFKVAFYLFTHRTTYASAIHALLEVAIELFDRLLELKCSNSVTTELRSSPRRKVSSLPPPLCRLNGGRGIVCVVDEWACLLQIGAGVSGGPIRH